MATRLALSVFVVMASIVMVREAKHTERQRRCFSISDFLAPVSGRQMMKALRSVLPDSSHTASSLRSSSRVCILSRFCSEAGEISDSPALNGFLVIQPSRKPMLKIRHSTPSSRFIVAILGGRLWRVCVCKRMAL
jgi:hypothetical protein